MVKKLSNNSVSRAADHQKPSAAKSSPVPFAYGWCKTDDKDGKRIRPEYRSIDFFKDKRYAGRINSMLKQLGLPLPRKGEIFRGTHHDLLFLNSHGVVLRIGPLDVADLVNPGILQPLGWLEDSDKMVSSGKGYRSNKIPLTVAIYPGTILARNYRGKITGNLYDFMEATEQRCGDVNERNTGIIRMQDKGKEIAVEVLIDIDNEFNNTLDNKIKSLKRVTLSEKTSLQNRGGKPEALSRALSETFNKAVSNKELKYRYQAFAVHQPLRRLFWETFDNVAPVTGKPDTTRRDAFWRKCATVVNKPKTATVPVWRPEIKRGKISYKREKITIKNLVLHRPWTGEEKDRQILPLHIDKNIKGAIQKEHNAATRKQDKKKQAVMQPALFLHPWHAR